jgi:hypothetical protein
MNNKINKSYFKVIETGVIVDSDVGSQLEKRLLNSPKEYQLLVFDGGELITPKVINKAKEEIAQLNTDFEALKVSKHTLELENSDLKDKIAALEYILKKNEVVNTSISEKSIPLEEISPDGKNGQDKDLSADTSKHTKGKSKTSKRKVKGT